MVLFSSFIIFYYFNNKKIKKSEQQIPINSQKKINPCRTTAFQITPFQGGTLVHECWWSAEKRFNHTSPLNRERSRQDKLITLLNRDRNVCESGLMPRGISQICLTLTRVFKEPQKWISTHEYTRRSKVKFAVCFAGREWKLHSKVQHHKYNPSFMCLCVLMRIMHARVQLLTVCIKLFTQTPKESLIQSNEKTSGRSWEKEGGGWNESEQLNSYP